MAMYTHRGTRLLRRCGLRVECLHLDELSAEPIATIVESQMAGGGDDE